MRPRRAASLLIVLAACGGGAPPDPAPHVAPTDRLAIVRGGRCGACHALAPPFDALLAAPPALPMAAAAQRFVRGPGPVVLAEHFAGVATADVAAWLASLAAGAAPKEPVAVADADFVRGERLVRELACAACHAPQQLGELARTDHESLVRTLAGPFADEGRPAHVPLSPSEARAIAAHLLRSQRQDGQPVRGFAWQCFQTKVDGDDLPDVEGAVPAARGVSERIDVDVRTRDEHFVLLFGATLDVPATGEWTFTVGSDDGSWLWIDERLVVDNRGQKPHRRAKGSVQLTAGPHALRVAYTQAAGGKSLEVLWQGPGVEREVLPAARATATAAALVPPPVAVPAPAADAVARGRTAARAARCDRCHACDDAELTALPPPPPAPAWRELAAPPGGGAGSTAPRAGCPVPAAAELAQEIGALPAAPLAPALQLALALQTDGCLSCHARDGRRGLPPAVRQELTEVEDLGEEGRLPPDLTAVGRRLRPSWIERVVADGHAVRPYVRVRMPAFGAARARQYAAWFAAVDAPGVVDVDPPFSVEAAELGRELVGSGGRNCITCHTVAGRAALGPQGMDLTLQYQRLRPGWLLDWLAQPTALRPGTRMPTLWPVGNARDREEIDAVRCWLSLGAAAPLPRGLVVPPGSFVLEPIERPILHGAFLDGVSARCLAVGTPERTHFAFDLATARLVWLWRGAFLDAEGTWFGRAGKLLTPLGQDRVALDDFELDGGAVRHLVGQRRTADGYPVLRVAAGEARYEDEVRPRLAAGGSEVVRTIRCTAGTLTLSFPAAAAPLYVFVGEAPAARHTLTRGQTLEVVYRW